MAERDADRDEDELFHGISFMLRTSSTAGPRRAIDIEVTFQGDGSRPTRSIDRSDRFENASSDTNVTVSGNRPFIVSLSNMEGASEETAQALAQDVVVGSDDEQELLEEQEEQEQEQEDHEPELRSNPSFFLHPPSFLPPLRHPSLHSPNLLPLLPPLLPTLLPLHLLLLLLPTALQRLPSTHSTPL